MSRPPSRNRAAWVSLAAGATSASLVIVLLVHTIREADDDIVWPLLITIGLSALIALVAAVPGLRQPRERPIALEGVELAVVSIAILAMIAFFFYVALGSYGG